MTDNSSMNEGNIAKLSSEAPIVHSRTAMNNERSIHLVVADSLLDIIAKQIPDVYNIIKLSELDSDLLLDKIAGGDNMVWIGNGDDIPADLWCGTFRPADSGLTATLADNCPLLIDSPDFKPSLMASAYIKR